jgi:hypothetical protein
MKIGWIQLSGAAGAAVLALLASAPVPAADTTPGVTAVAAEELDKRSKEAAEADGDSKGMSDSAVRVLMTYAFSIIPEEKPGPDGETIKIDKSDPNKYFIPTPDARRVIRAATRSAYAEVCELPDLVSKNYETMMKGEEARKTWSPEQLVMIDALHMFSVSYFTGNIKITAKEEPDAAPAQPADSAPAVAKGAEEPPAAGGDDSTRVITAEPPKCPEAQKQKVQNAINAYIQEAQAKQ